MTDREPIRCTKCGADLSLTQIEFHYSRHHDAEVPRSVLIAVLRERDLTPPAIAKATR